MRFKDKVALITGASRGIGREIAMDLASKGAVVILNYVKSDELAKQTAREITNKGGNVVLSKFDVCNYEEVQSCISALIDDFGKIDLLVNNAGITKDKMFLRMMNQDWDSVFDINIKGVFNCTKFVIRNMSRNRYGRIVNIVSVVGEMGNAGQVNYSSTKAGLIGFTKSIAKEFASRGITVNAVSPGFIETDITKNLPLDLKEKYLDSIPLGRFGQPEDVSGVVTFLLSDNASYITGEVIRVNGGLYM